MSKSNKPTKAGSLTPAFRTAAVANGDGALAFMLMSAFGVSLATIMAVATRALATDDASVIVLSMTAAVQIRNHVVFVGADHNQFKAKYPELVITGQRDQGDQFNYGALRVLGFLFAHVTRDPLGGRIISKAGSAVTGEQVTDSEAGKINKEMSSSWTLADIQACRAWIQETRQETGDDLDLVVAAFASQAAEFGNTMRQGHGQ
jgi:hypothetical protein